MKEEFQPQIIGFLCNWCSYTGADLAGTARMKIPSSIRVIRVMCSGRIDPLFVLRGLLRGADGIMMMGCHPGDCHYQKGNYNTRRRFVMMQAILDTLGLEKERLGLWWVSASEGVKYARVTKEFSDKVTKLGPNPFAKEIFL
jgi:F420-non-reducing hydrogenase iron-sulfur subunit